jgi:hypothetical protein
LGLLPDTFALLARYLFFDAYRRFGFQRVRCIMALRVVDLPIWTEVEPACHPRADDRCIVCGSSTDLLELYVRHGGIRDRIELEHNFVTVCTTCGEDSFLAGLRQDSTVTEFASDRESCAYCYFYGAGPWLDVVWNLWFGDVCLCRSGNYQVCSRCRPAVEKCD